MDSLRARLTAEQLDTLEFSFRNNNYPSLEERVKLATSFGIHENKVKIWFKNKRARELKASATGKRRPRTRFGAAQLVTLEEAFRNSPIIDTDLCKKLTHKTGLSEITVKTWFQNRRTKQRKAKNLDTILAEVALKVQDEFEDNCNVEQQNILWRRYEASIRERRDSLESIATSNQSLMYETESNESNYTSHASNLISPAPPQHGMSNLPSFNSFFECGLNLEPTSLDTASYSSENSTWCEASSTYPSTFSHCFNNISTLCIENTGERSVNLSKGNSFENIQFNIDLSNIFDKDASNKIYCKINWL